MSHGRTKQYIWENNMKVKELIEILSGEDPEDEVVVPTDHEFLYHETIMEVQNATWKPETQEIDFERDSPRKGEKRCVILVPEH